MTSTAKNKYFSRIIATLTAIAMMFFFVPIPNAIAQVRYEVGDTVIMIGSWWSVRRTADFSKEPYSETLDENAEFTILELRPNYFYKVSIPGWDPNLDTYIQIAPYNQEWFELKPTDSTPSTPLDPPLTTTSTTMNTSIDTITTTETSTEAPEETTTTIVDQPAVFENLKSGDQCEVIGESIRFYKSPLDDAEYINNFEPFWIEKVVSEKWIAVYVPKANRPYYVKDTNFSTQSHSTGYEPGAQVKYIGDVYGKKDVYSIPDMSSDVFIIGEVKQDEVLSILEKLYDDWYLIEKNDGLRGFIKINYRVFSLDGKNPDITTTTASISTSTTSNTTVTTTAKKSDTILFLGDEWNIRESNDINSKVIGTLYNNTSKEGIAYDEEWYQLLDGGFIRINTDERKFFVLNSYEVPFKYVTVGDILVFKGDEWNLREDATTNSDSLGILNPYDKFTIMDIKGEWVYTPSGWIGITDETNFQFFRLY